MTTELRDLVAELVADQPNHTIDLDREIARGRRRTRYRRLGAAGLVTASVLGLTGGFIALSDACAASRKRPSFCTAPVKLADGSTAYRIKNVSADIEFNEAIIERPDGTRISVFSGAQKPRGSTHGSVLSADRVFEIAKNIAASWRW